jgi:endonuclease/exonuclease/phosphatase family metal-dependent hydrolase
VFEPHPRAELPLTDTLAVISWNVHVGAGDVDDLIRRLKRGDFTDGAPVADFVLLLQEAHRRDESVPATIDRRLPVPHRIAHTPRPADDDVRAIARKHGLALLYVPAMRNGAQEEREDRGNAIASTLPLDDARVLELPFDHQRRVVPIAIVEGGSPGRPRWRLRIAGIHFDTSLALAHGGPFAARRREAEAVISALADSATATLAGGDFNTWFGDREPAVSSLRRAFPDTPRRDAAPTWRGPLGVHASLDHVFVRGDIRSIVVRRLSDRFGSDHYPLLVRLSF